MFLLPFYPLYHSSLKCFSKFTHLPSMPVRRVGCEVSQMEDINISFHPISLWRDCGFGHTVRDLSRLSTWKLLRPWVQLYQILCWTLAQVRALPLWLAWWTLTWLAYLLKPHQRGLGDTALFPRLRLRPLWEAKPLFGGTEVLNSPETEMEYCSNVLF